jgi:hypothetical protein
MACLTVTEASSADESFALSGRSAARLTSGRFSQSLDAKDHDPDRIVCDVIACASLPDKNFMFMKFFVPAWIRHYAIEYFS